MLDGDPGGPPPRTAGRADVAVPGGAAVNGGDRSSPNRIHEMIHFAIPPHHRDPSRTAKSLKTVTGHIIGRTV
jgi:hypothetical protein